MPEVPVNPESANVAKGGSKKPGGKTKWLISIVGVLAIGAAILFWPRAQSPSKATGAGATETTLPLETFVINLNGTGQRGYLRVGITLGLSRPLKKEDVPIALVRDAILSVLTNTQPDQLLAAEGKQNLKAEIVKALQESAPNLGVENVYFTEFLVQM